MRVFVLASFAMLALACGDGDGDPDRDGGPRDSGARDSGAHDSGVRDAGGDTGSGPADAGDPDAGARRCGIAPDCSLAACPTGRTCACADGILDVDGRTGTQWPMADVLYRRRPLTADDDGTSLLVRDLYLHDVTNQKALHVTRCESTSGWSYDDIAIQCVEIARVNRDAAGAAAGLHMDFIKIDGCGDAAPIDVLLEDVDVHDGNVYSLVSDARLGTITLRRVRHVAEGALQIGTLSMPELPEWGRIDLVAIEDSPDLRVALMGEKIGEVRVVRSPMLRGGDRSSAPVRYDAASCPSPGRPLASNERCDL